MDKNKCPKLKTQKTFWKKIVEQYNILKLLKEHRGHIYPTMGHTIYLLVHKIKLNFIH
jgi:hypothetical protein